MLHIQRLSGENPSQEKYNSCSEEDTLAVAADLAKRLKNGDFVAIYGDLGSGKTVFARGIVSTLLPEEEFAGSPTYALVNEYGGEGTRVCHFDLYRIKDEDDLDSIGFYDYRGCVNIVEWAENITFALPERRYDVRFTKRSADEREITITGVNEE